MNEIIDDPFALLEANSKKAVDEAALFEHIALAKKQLLFGKDGANGAVKVRADAAFWSHLALGLKVAPNHEISTLRTDGKTLECNPSYIAGMKSDERLGCVVHEVFHCAMSHHARIGSRDPKNWNIACDLVINPMILEAGYKLPKCRIVPGEGEFRSITKGLSVEETYNELAKNQPPKPPEDKEDDQDGDGNDPGGCGTVKKPGDGSQAAIQQAEAEMEVAIAQAQQCAKQQGALSAGLQRLIGEALAPKVDWRNVLREFVSKRVRQEYSWNPLNRRFIWQGLRLPGLGGETIGDLVVAVDCSGSIGQHEIDVFGAEVQAILDAYAGVKLTILYHDDAIMHVQTWSPDEGPLVLEAKGGGGTSHVCVTDWIAEQGDDVTCLICLTDLYSSFPAEPTYPVLWCSTTKEKTGPFGRTVHVEVE